MRPRMYGSTLMTRLRTTTSPSPTSTVASSKSSGTGSPTGRRARRISREVMPGSYVGSAPMELEARHAVVTGGASGIGRALALRFADEQPRAITVADLDEDGARATAEAVGGLAVRTDVGREDDIARLVA